MPQLTAIHVYPIKSLDRVTVQHCRVLPSGALEHDRCLALIDGEGNVMTAKRHPAVHQLRALFDLAIPTVELAGGGRATARFHLYDEQKGMVEWLSRFFGFAVQLHYDSEQGFPDDVESNGPTVVSRATLEAVANWFSLPSLAETGRRFRANLELGGDEPFWEDRLVANPAPVRFQVGGVEYWGTNPCQRCPVPTRSPDTGEVVPNFAQVFSQRRQQSLPPWAATARFDHFYRLSTNTRLAALGSGRIQVGDTVRVIDSGRA